jgi:hypothetical protein|tara:strand:+ start:298 stop:546 length:249 start_codon:yes stop_codon:yes gene_type:complete
MINGAKNMYEDVTVFLTVSGGVMSWMANLNQVLTTFLLLTGLVYAIIRIVGKLKINKGVDLDNKKKELELKNNKDGKGVTNV